MAKTGKTQGMKFSNMPPKNAPNIAKIQVAQGAVEMAAGAELNCRLKLLALVAEGGSVHSCHLP
jgi:hypothetical protein